MNNRSHIVVPPDPPASAVPRSAASTLSAAPIVRVVPPLERWADIASPPDKSARWSIDARAGRFREQLGLATDRPIIMSGHQAQLWHPGILAKLIAITSASAPSTRVAPLKPVAQAVWLVVDHDTNDPFTIDYPHFAPGPVVAGAPAQGVRGTLQRRSWKLQAGDSKSAAGLTTGPASHVPTGRLAPLMPTSAPLGLEANGPVNALPGISEGLVAIREALIRHLASGSAAEQFGLAAISLARPYLQGPVQMLLASSLASTDLFAEIIEQMASEPERMRLSYNRAVATSLRSASSGTSHRTRGIAPLAEGELPLWRIEPTLCAIRQRVDVQSLRQTPLNHLAPRALLLTGLFRMTGADVFVHGTGGAGEEGDAGYDALTERWLADWLGAELAPMAMATATLRLELGETTPELSSLDDTSIERAFWLAHAARHHPGVLGDTAGEFARTQAVARIKSLGHRGDAEQRRARHAAYRDLQHALAAARDRHGASIAELLQRAARMAALKDQIAIASDRTWAFPLYQPEQLGRLVEMIAGEPQHHH